LLLISAKCIPSKFNRWSVLLGAWHSWLAANPNASAAQVCLAFVSTYPQINRVVVGVDDLMQLKQLVHAMQMNVSVEFPDIECNDEDLINPSRW
jgi:aryl-alcohol dehydrogenase-like predicted oxidoreductase